MDSVLCQAKKLTFNTKEQNLDAFNRIRTCEPFTLLEFKQTRGRNKPQITEKTTGNAQITNFSLTSSAVLLTNSVSDECIQQTVQTATYQPGKSIQCFFTAVFNVSGVDFRSRAGLFDNDNGIYMEYDQTENQFYCAIRFLGVDIRIPQTEWNGEKLPFVIEPTATQLFSFDATWLGVGSVQFYILYNDKQYHIHTFKHSNINQNIYTRNLNLPIRYQIVKTGITPSDCSMRSICGSVSSEGGYLPQSFSFSANTGTTEKDIDLGGNALIALRLKQGSGLENTRVDLTKFSILGGDKKYRYDIWYVPPDSSVPVGLPGSSWNDVSSESAVEYSFSQTDLLLPSDSILLDSGYSLKEDLFSDIIRTDLRLGFNVDKSISAYIILEIIPFDNAKKFSGSLTWSEYF